MNMVLGASMEKKRVLNIFLQKKLMLLPSTILSCCPSKMEPNYFSMEEIRCRWVYEKKILSQVWE